MSDSVYAAPVLVDDIDQCAFYHTMDIPGVGEVPGNFDLRGVIDDYLGPISFEGQRVLEIGPASGFLTFEMEKRGAEVVSIELSEEIPWDYVPYDSPLLDAWLTEQKQVMQRMRNGYWFAHRRFGSRARVHYGSAYDLPSALGRFDIAVMAAVLLHNRDPLGIIANCARVTDRKILIVDLYDRELDATGRPALELCPTRENKLVYTWWHLAPDLLRRYLAVLGFDEAHFGVHTEQFAEVPGGQANPLDHFTLIAERGPREG